MSEETRRSALNRLRRRLAAAGIGEAAADARRLLLDGLEIGAAEFALRPEAPLSAVERRRLGSLCERRAAGEPVGRILGRRGFWGMDFALGPATLEPRADSETVVVTALALAPPGDSRRGESRRILDLGTGTGCLLVALLSEWTDAWGLGLDRSPAALAVARGNALRNGVGSRACFAAADWTAPLAGRFDVIVSNPPYIASSRIAGLSPDVRLHDPVLALDGGADGLEAYRRILPACAALLGPNGIAVVEIGQGQEHEVVALGRGAGLDLVRAAPDLSGIVRALAFAPARFESVAPREVPAGPQEKAC